MPILDVVHDVVGARRRRSGLAGGRITNKRDPAPDELVQIVGAGGKAVPVHRDAALAYHAMLAKARQDGIRPPLLELTSGYRSTAQQVQLFERAAAKYGSPAKARKWVAAPGGSAHHSGGALDFNLGLSNDSKNVKALAATPVYKWLRANAGTFGFAPYEAEPWHWECDDACKADARKRWGKTGAAVEAVKARLEARAEKIANKPVEAEPQKRGLRGFFANKRNLLIVAGSVLVVLLAFGAKGQKASA